MPANARNRGLTPQLADQIDVIVYSFSFLTPPPLHVVINSISLLDLCLSEAGDPWMCLIYHYGLIRQHLNFTVRV